MLRTFHRAPFHIAPPVSQQEALKLIGLTPNLEDVLLPPRYLPSFGKAGKLVAYTQSDVERLLGPNFVRKLGAAGIVCLRAPKVEVVSYTQTKGVKDVDVVVLDRAQIQRVAHREPCLVIGANSPHRAGMPQREPNYEHLFVT
jgi:hypothetical protein